MVANAPDAERGDIIVVADLSDDSEDVGPIEGRRDLEMSDAATLDELFRTIRRLGHTVRHIAGPRQLAEAADDLASGTVLTIYGGQGSRNRMALVPAICETMGLTFIGPDAYGRLVAQDKEISKRLALEAGLKTPPWRVIRRPEDLAAGLNLHFPAVVKPLMEGSSIGIGPRNLAETPEAAESLARELLERFQQPVLIEGFVPGREVAYVKIENAGDDAWAFSEIVMGRDPAYFETRLFDAEEKLVRQPDRSVRNIDGELTAEDKEALDRLLEIYGDYGYCRVDGRFENGRFHFLELTPDAWIAPTGQFAMAFTDRGWTYDKVIAGVLASAGPAPQDR